MAMSLTFSNMIVHFHYLDIAKPQTSSAHLFQKVTANYVFGKLLKPLHIRRIRVCASYNDPKSEGEPERQLSRTPSGDKAKREAEPERQLLRTSSGDKAYYTEELEILTLLKKNVDLTHNLNLAEELKNRFAEIPEERWDRLFDKILKSEHIPRIWEIAGTRYRDTSADTTINAAVVLYRESKPLSPVFWSGKFSGVTWLARLTGHFKMAFFLGEDGQVYGRIISGKSIVRSISNKVRPLYFAVKNPTEVPDIAQPCDLTFQFGDGQRKLLALPEGFPNPAKHPRTFDGQLVHIRFAGPNVLVGQAMKLEKVWGELVLVKDSAAKK